MNPQRWALVLACAFPVLGAFLVSSGVFTIDELIYLISADALARNGSLIVDNGYAEFGSRDLKLWFLIEGPNGLTPQYPPGQAALALPFFVTLGAQGLVLLNSLAAAGSAVLTWALARRLYQDAAVATVAVLMLTFCTFQLDYAWSLWPHMTTAFFVLLAFYLAAGAMEHQTTGAVLTFSIGSGLAVGAGVLLRADAVLVLPIIAACVVVAARHPFLTTLGGFMGLVPGVAIGAFVNLFKFGTPNILSYGRTGTGGGTDITSHLSTLVVIGAALLALFALRFVKWTRPRLRIGAVLLLAGAIALLAIPETRDILARLGRGFTALFVDSRTINDTRLGIERLDDGSLLFWGVAKKAMFQSLPWLAILIALMLTPWRKEHIRPNLMLLCFVTIWSLPFVALAWHGGFSSSMRYFLPMLPALVILGSATIVEMAAHSKRPIRLTLVGIMAGLALGIALFDSGNLQTDGFTQQALTLYVFSAALLVIAVVSLFRRFAPSLNTAGLVAAGVGLGTATFGSVLVDVSFSQQLRARSAAVSTVAESLKGPVLIHGRPSFFAFGVARPDVILAIGERITDEADTDLFVDAIRSGYRAVAPIQTAEFIASTTDLSYVDLDISPDRQWVEIVAGPKKAE